MCGLASSGFCSPAALIGAKEFLFAFHAVGFAVFDGKTDQVVPVANTVGQAARARDFTGIRVAGGPGCGQRKRATPFGP